ncbi:MAG: hypothetical protein J6Z14_05430 [Prevotella sp.]|nr:hypothetical protein [Prevotella sp.]
MKQILISIVMMLTIATAAMAKPADTLSTDTVNVDEVEVFSDTTATDSAFSDSFPFDEEEDRDEWEDWEETDVHSIMSNLGIDGGSIAGMFFVLCVLFLLFILLPIVIIGLILYFIYKNRKNKLRLAEMAMKNGKPIPVDVMGNYMATSDTLWNKGIKQVFLGVGLAILLWVILGKLGLAIGALILLMGCGNMLIAYQEQKKQREKDLYDKMFKTGDEV